MTWLDHSLWVSRHNLPSAVVRAQTLMMQAVVNSENGSMLSWRKIPRLGRRKETHCMHA